MEMRATVESAPRPSAPRTSTTRSADTWERRLARSYDADEGLLTDAEFGRWLAERRRYQTQDVRRIPFHELRRWRFDDRTGNIEHASGRFFSIEGLRVRVGREPSTTWQQPVVRQPEVGILGIAVAMFDGLAHCLVQAKTEPGNVNGVQISPTVQATESNYTRVHGGAVVPYLDCFRSAKRKRPLVDILQSEQGSSFYRKQNRNMVVEVDPGTAVLPDFCWLTLGQLHRLQRVDNLMHMNTATVLSCLSGKCAGPADRTGLRDWLDARREKTELTAQLVPLEQVEGWYRTDDAISHERDAFFTVLAVDVTSRSREVSRWTQPLIEPKGAGVVAMLVRWIDGVPHALVRAGMEPGHRHKVEIAPTVQCVPRNHTGLAGRDRPPLLDFVLDSPAEKILFDAEMSDEGGRFHHSWSRYLIVLADGDVREIDEVLGDLASSFRWTRVTELASLLGESYQVNIQARVLVAAMREVL
jgi:oxidase EvaA